MLMGVDPPQGGGGRSEFMWTFRTTYADCYTADRAYADCLRSLSYAQYFPRMGWVEEGQWASL
jgi:hypothetical protein